MNTLQNDKFLRALLRQPVESTPVWMMRQAGRYLPEYRAIRQQAGSFMDLCKNPELACEVTLQPLRRYRLDAAILFSDILTIPDAMGLGLYFSEGEGPRFHKPIVSAKDIQALTVPDPESALSYVMEAVRTIRKELQGRVPLIGFSGSPWTLATYMLEGGSSKDFARSKALLFDQPRLMHQLLDTLADAVSSYLNAQIAAGAQAVMIFDTWGGVLTPRDYNDFSLPYMQKIVANLTKEAENRTVPSIVFSKGIGHSLVEMMRIGANALGVDWTMNLSDARQMVGDKVALQGNMDPCILYASAERIQQEVQTVLASYGRGNGHIFNLGHGIHPAVDPEKVKVFIDAVHEYSPKYHI